MKIRRVDFSADEFLVGTMSLSNELVGAYWRFCSLQYSIGRPIPVDGKVIRGTFGWSVEEWLRIRDELTALGKIKRTRTGYINPRVHDEILRAGKRIETARKSGKKGGRPKRDAITKHKGNNELQKTKRIIFQKANHQPSTIKESPSEPLFPTLTDSPNPSDSPNLPESPPSVADIAEAVSGWNRFAATHGLAQIRKLTVSRRKSLATRLAEHGLLSWHEALRNIERSPLCLGQVEGRNGASPWRVSFDFMLTENGFLKLLEGTYEGGPGPPPDDSLERALAATHAKMQALDDERCRSLTEQAQLSKFPSN